MEQSVEELCVRETGEAFVVFRGIGEGQGKTGVPAGEFGDPARVRLVQCRVTPRQQRLDDVGAIRVDANDGCDVGVVLPDIVLDGDEVDVGRVRHLGGEGVVCGSRTVVQNNDGLVVVGLEPRDRLMGSRIGSRAEVGVNREASIERIGTDRGFEQGLNDARFPHSGQADDAQRSVRGAHDVSDGLDPLADSEPR